jgi:hypothetical protein
MVSYLFFSQLVLIALVWLFIPLLLAWPNRVAAAPQRSVEPESVKPRRKSSTEPKAFADLTHKPLCPLCDAECEAGMAPTPVRPDPMAPTPRRPREIDTSAHFCPQEG